MAAGTLVGLDIGSTTIRAVETRRGKNGPSIVRWGDARMPEGTVRSGIIQDHEAVTVALRKLWSASHFGCRKVVLGLTNPQVVVREMSVSNLPGRKMREALPFQVRDALPLPVERSILDFCPLEDPGTAATVRGLLIAAPKDAVLAAVQAVERASLHVTRVDLASLALLRAVAGCDGQVEAIVDIGAQATNVVVHEDGAPLIVRTIPRGGDDITSMVASRLGLPAAEADALKCRVGLSTDTDPAVAAVIREAVGPLINEIRSSFAYVTAGERHSPVTRVVLSGGASQLVGLADELGRQLDLTVVAANPGARLNDAARGKQDGIEGFQSAAAVSIGLTLGAA
jgi:type IV pilus assembly protein PilM